MAEPTPPRPLTPSGQPDRRALLEAYQNLVRSEEDKHHSEAHRQPIEPSGRGFWITMSLAIIALSALLLLQPGWLFTKPAAEAPAVTEASLRVRMFVEMERIEQFRSDAGRLPASLSEAGVPEDGLTFHVSDGSYILTGMNGTLSLSYSSETPASTFLGDSYRIVRERGRP